MAGCIAGIARCEKSYDSLIDELNRRANGEFKKTGDQLKNEWLKKFC